MSGRIQWTAVSFLLALSGLPSLSLSANADSFMALTPIGSTEFTLSRFANGFPTCCGNIGPLGITFTSAGAVVVSDYPNGTVRVFANDVDNQSAAAATIGQNAGHDR